MLGDLFSLGYSGLGGADDLRRLLAGTGIDTIVDVRLSQWSRNRAFSSRQTHVTVAEAGLSYVHLPGLGNLAYKSGGIRVRNIEAIETVLAALRAGRNVALMCVCPQPEDCHRLTLCEEAVRRMPDLQIVHLTRPLAAFLAPDASDEQLQAFVDALLPHTPEEE